jgi:hypothetical protein
VRGRQDKAYKILKELNKSNRANINPITLEEWGENCRNE